MQDTPTSKYNRIQELISAYEVFESLHGSQDLAQFGKYLVNKSTNQEPSLHIDLQNSGVIDYNPIINGMMPISASLAMLIRRLYRYTIIYSKTGLESIGLENLEDFNYLISVKHLNNRTKTELINWNIAEFSSGIEVIKRLIRKNLIEETAHPTDKRSKLLKITPLGENVLKDTFTIMPEILNIAFGTLKNEEISKMLKILYPLEKWHWHHLSQARELNWQDLIQHFQDSASTKT
jgi:hypothetical protein